MTRANSYRGLIIRGMETIVLYSYYIPMRTEITRSETYSKVDTFLLHHLRRVIRKLLVNNRTGSYDLISVRPNSSLNLNTEARLFYQPLKYYPMYESIQVLDSIISNYIRKPHNTCKLRLEFCSMILDKRHCVKINRHE